MSSLIVEQKYTATEFHISAPGAWEISVPDSGRETNINIIMRGSGNTRASTGLFGTGMHTAYLREGGRTTAQTTWEEREVTYVPPAPELPKPPPPVPSFPHIQNPPIPPEPTGLQPGGYWRVGMASPNDSTRMFMGSKFGSRADCIRSWQSAGYAGDGGCTYVAPPTPAPDTSLDKWKQGVTDTIAKGIGDLTTWMQGALQGLRDSLAGLQKTVQEESAAWRKAYDGIWDKLEGWLEERIVRILFAGLNKEAKEYNQQRRKT